MRNILQKEIRFLVRTGVFIIAALTIIAAHANSVEVINQPYPLVVVNGDTITSKNIDQLLIKTHKSMAMEEKQSFDYDKLLTKSINDLLILQEAYSLGLDENDYLVDLLYERRKEVIQQLYLAHNFRPEIIIPDQEIDDYFEANLIRYQFRTISLASLDEANEIYELLSQGHSFDSLATARSVDHRRFKKGLHSVTFKMNVDKILLTQSDKMEVGEFSKPIIYQDNYSIIKLEKRLEANRERFDSFKDKIIDRLTEGRKEVAWTKFMQDLLQKYPVTVDSNIIEEIRADQADVLKMEFRQGTDNPVLKIDEEYFITDNVLRNEISHSLMNAGTTPFDVILFNSINKKQEELLSTYAAMQNGFIDSARVIEWYYHTMDSTLIEMYLKEMIVAKIAFNRDDFQEYYNLNLEEFRKPDEFLLDDMLLADHNQSHKAANALKDGAQWSFIYKSYKASSEKTTDEDKWMTLINFPEKIQKELIDLQVGQTSAPLQSNEGYVIFKIKDRRAGGIKPIEEVDMKIREIMFQKIFNELLDEHLTKLKDNSEIVHIENNINLYFGKDKE